MTSISDEELLEENGEVLCYSGEDSGDEQLDEDALLGSDDDDDDVKTPVDEETSLKAPETSGALYFVSTTEPDSTSGQIVEPIGESKKVEATSESIQPSEEVGLPGSVESTEGDVQTPTANKAGSWSDDSDNENEADRDKFSSERKQAPIGNRGGSRANIPESLDDVVVRPEFPSVPHNKRKPLPKLFTLNLATPGAAAAAAAAQAMQVGQIGARVHINPRFKGNLQVPYVAKPAPSASELEWFKKTQAFISKTSSAVIGPPSGPKANPNQPSLKPSSGKTSSSAQSNQKETAEPDELSEPENEEKIENVEGVDAGYLKKLQEQRRLREKMLREKEKRRREQAKELRPKVEQEIGRKRRAESPKRSSPPPRALLGNSGRSRRPRQRHSRSRSPSSKRSHAHHKRSPQPRSTSPPTTADNRKKRSLTPTKDLLTESGKEKTSNPDRVVLAPPQQPSSGLQNVAKATGTIIQKRVLSDGTVEYVVRKPPAEEQHPPSPPRRSGTLDLHSSRDTRHRRRIPRSRSPVSRSMLSRRRRARRSRSLYSDTEYSDYSDSDSDSSQSGRHHGGRRRGYRRSTSPRRKSGGGLRESKLDVLTADAELRKSGGRAYQLQPQQAQCYLRPAMVSAASTGVPPGAPTLYVMPPPIIHSLPPPPVIMRPSMPPQVVMSQPPPPGIKGIAIPQGGHFIQQSSTTSSFNPSFEGAPPALYTSRHKIVRSYRGGGGGGGHYRQSSVGNIGSGMESTLVSVQRTEVIPQQDLHVEPEPPADPVPIFPAQANEQTVYPDSQAAVTVSGLAGNTGQEKIHQLAQAFGPVRTVNLDTAAATANVIFEKFEHAKNFQRAYDKRILDLSKITVDVKVYESQNG